MKSQDKSNNVIPIMHCFDDNYVIPAAVSFNSMLRYANKKYNYKLYVLHNDITVQNQEQLKEVVNQYDNAELFFINMQHQFEDILCGFEHSIGHLRKEVLYKLLAPSMFPQYDRLIITDVDVVFQDDISSSYFVLESHTGVYYAGVRAINPAGTFLREYYNNNYKNRLDEEEFRQNRICGGYLVANLCALREDGMEKVMVAYLTENMGKLPQLEQDVINFCCRDKQIMYLPLKYVVCSYMYDFMEKPAICASDPYYTYREYYDAMLHPVQLHYATSTKPWNQPYSTKAEIWHSELRLLPIFYLDFKRKNKYSDFKGEKGLFPCADISSPNCVPLPHSDIKVSVVCCCYNHEQYIEKTLKGIVGQKTSFNYEVIVCDDASSDSTPEKINQFVHQYPGLFKKTILRNRNVGIGENYYEALSLAEGEYLAICDGDDEWIDMNKLQKQVDFLDKNQEYTIVCTDFIKRSNEKDIRFDVTKYIGFLKQKYTLEDLVFYRFVGASTVMFRWMLRGRVPTFLKHYSIIDFPLTVIHASKGYIGVLSEVTTIYNFHAQSISNDNNLIINQSTILLKEVNQYLGFKLISIVNAYCSAVNASQKQNKPMPITEFASLSEQPIQTSISSHSFLHFLHLLYAKYCPEMLKKLYRKLMPYDLYIKINRIVRKSSTKETQ